MAAHTPPLSAPDSSMPAGDIMNVTHELATTMMTAKIGTPRMNAAKFRCSCATAHTARRDPNTGNARYAGSFAAFCAVCASTGSTASTVSATPQKTSSQTARRAKVTMGKPSRKTRLFPQSHERRGMLYGQLLGVSSEMYPHRFDTLECEA